MTDKKQVRSRFVHFEAWLASYNNSRHCEIWTQGRERLPLMLLECVDTERRYYNSICGVCSLKPVSPDRKNEHRYIH